MLCLIQPIYVPKHNSNFIFYFISMQWKFLIVLNFTGAKWSILAHKATYAAASMLTGECCDIIITPLWNIEHLIKKKKITRLFSLNRRRVNKVVELNSFESPLTFFVGKKNGSENRTRVRFFLVHVCANLSMVYFVCVDVFGT